MTYIEAMNVVFDHLWSGVTSEFGRIEEYNEKYSENIWNGEYEYTHGLNCLWREFASKLENFMCLVYPMRRENVFDGLKFIESLELMSNKISSWRRANIVGGSVSHQMYHIGSSHIDKNIVFICWVLSCGEPGAWFTTPGFPFASQFCV